MWLKQSKERHVQISMIGFGFTQMIGRKFGTSFFSANLVHVGAKPIISQHLN